MRNLIKQLTEEEGVVLHAYEDHLGYLTIGIGRLIDARRGGGISLEEAEYLLANDIKEKTAEVVRALPFFESLNDARKAVLVGMAFQMGTDGLLGFKNTLQLVRLGEYKAAGRGMLRSLWARQTPARAKRMAKQMETGEWVFK